MSTHSSLRRALRRLPFLALGAAAGCTSAHDSGERGRSHERLPQLSAAQPGTLVGTCDALAARLAGLPNTKITATTSVAAGGLLLAGQPVAAHCRVTGSMFERVSAVDGKTYAIAFEMRLPLAWNGRFWHQGNGGIDGAVPPATGALGGGPVTSALTQGFAVLSSDAGHTLAQGGPAFGIDPQARLDYGYQAVGKLTPMAKAVIAAAYGKGPDRSYFGGCSNGGRHALVAAARYANDYDGFLAGAPGYNLPLAATANIFGAQRYATVATGDATTIAGLETAFTPAERAMVSKAVVNSCDTLDGVADGMVQDTRACQSKFNLMRDVPTCSGARDGGCLTQAQKQVVASIFKGATLANGERFYAGFPYDAGHGTAGVAFWEFNASLNLDSGAVGMIFKTPPVSAAGFNGPAFTLGSNIDSLVAQINATDATYTESGMSFMTPPNATDLSAVRRRGGKILAYHGVSDAIFSVEDTEAWYRGVQRKTAGNAASFARLYNVPGMGHCAGGPATDQADFITPLVAWVEQGVAPQAIVAQARGAGNAGGVNTDLPAAWSAARTRPLCPYPSVARYGGQGDVEAAGSFWCERAQGSHAGDRD
jgi:hypothetical protein